MKLNLVLLVLVLVTGFLAWVMPPMLTSEAVDEERSQLIYATFQTREEALRVARQVDRLTLASYDEEAKEVVEFTIALQDGRWVIPSHYDYPADGGDKVGTTAGSVLALEQGREVTDAVADHADLGVVDPRDPDAAEGHGLRITMAYAGGKELCDLIVGKRPEGAWDKRYVRDAGDNRVYEAKVRLDVKPEFTEWVERDLLKLDRKDVAEMVVKNYRVVDKEVQVRGVPMMVRELEDVEETVFSRPAGDDAKWAISGDIPEGKVLDENKVTSLLSGVDDIRISGIRPQHLQSTSQAKLAQYGIFIHPQTGQILGNEGVDHVVTRDGMEYQIYFGEEVVGEGRVISSGLLDDADAAADGAEATKTADAAAGNGDRKKYRFAVVLVSYDPEKDQQLQKIAAEEAAATAEKEAEAKAGAETGDKPGAGGADDGAAAGTETKDGEEADGADEPDFAKQRDERLEEMRQRHKEVSERFLKWVFVISDDVFKRLRPDRESFFKDAPEEKKDGAPAPTPGDD